MVDINKNAPLVYFLVLNYCSHEDTFECYESIKKADYVNSRILVMDNDSPDGGGEYLLKKIRGEDFIQFEKNIGYAGGNNYGIEIAIKNGADYIFIVNPDVRIQPMSIENYIKVFEGDVKIGALNPVQISSINGPIDERFKNSVLRDVNEVFISENLGKNIVLDTEILLGAALMLSREAVENVGGFDPLYFAYGEEIDLCRRLKNCQYKLSVTFNFPVIHSRNYTNKKLDKFREYLRLKGRFLFILKDGNRSLLDSVKGFYYELRADIVSSRTKKKKLVYMRMIIWVVVNFYKILKSRKLEKKGMSHLALN